MPGAGREARDPAPLRHRHEGDLGAAAALPAALGQPPYRAARASALSRRLRFPAAALRQRRSGCRDRRLVGALPGRRRERAPAMLVPDGEPKKRRRGAKGGRRGGGRANAPSADSAPSKQTNNMAPRLPTLNSTAFVALGSNLSDPGRQVAAGIANWRPCRTPGSCAAPRCTAARRSAMRISPISSMPWRRSRPISRRASCSTPCSRSSSGTAASAIVPQCAAHAGSRPAALRRAVIARAGPDLAASAHARARLRAGAARRDRAATRRFPAAARRGSCSRGVDAASVVRQTEIPA